MADTPIPQDIYYGLDGDNFYSMADHKGQGLDFHRKWRERAREFPTRIGCGDVLSPEQHAVRMDLIRLLNRARAVGVVIEVRLEPQRPLAMGNYWMVGTTRKARHG